MFIKINVCQPNVFKDDYTVNDYIVNYKIMPFLRASSVTFILVTTNDTDHDSSVVEP